MKSSDFLTEQTEPLSADQSHAMPATFVLPDLKNQDVYLQYRFGLALASARAVEAGDVTIDTESVFGENMVVVARSPEEEETLRLALKFFGTHNRSNQVSTTASTEAPGTDTISPVPQNSGKTIKKS